MAEDNWLISLENLANDLPLSLLEGLTKFLLDRGLRGLVRWPRCGNGRKRS